MVGFDTPAQGQITEVAVVQLDIGGHQEQAFFYVVPHLAHYNVILGLPWMKKNHV